MRLVSFLRDHLFLILFLFISFFFFSPLFLKGLLPIPSDTIVGLYHPFRDYYAKEYPNGIPFKNFLITDPVRQLYPWKKLALESLTKLKLPLWNPYEMAGKPHLSNFQSSFFYPLNALLLLGPFPKAWSLFIFLQPVLCGIFLYLYLANLRLAKRAAFLGAVSFSFSGFSTVWLEWGTVVHVALWLPLILLSIDKVFQSQKTKGASAGQAINKRVLSWLVIFTSSLIVSFFAGHLQIFFYVFIFSFAYLVAKWFRYGRERKMIAFFSLTYLLFILITSIQWYPTLQFILYSARSVDQSMILTEGWFIPWQHLVQFLAPDFFGNPATLNYWGTWNYAELVGYIGLVPFFFALFSLFTRFDKKTLFFGTMLLLSLLFSLPTAIAKIPYMLNLPLISSSQPTRLIFLTCFSLSVLSSLGFDYFLKKKRKTTKALLITTIFIVIIFIILWLLVSLGNPSFIPPPNDQIAKRNLILPSIIFSLSAILLFCYIFIKQKSLQFILGSLIIVILVFDMYRFFNKFEPFTNSDYLYPKTKAMGYLKDQAGVFRIATTDSRILAPNIATYYKIQSIEGYDPLYLLSYAELIAALERNKPDISEPFGFNRIITPHNFQSKLVDLLNAKYILSLSDLSKPNFVKVFQEGETRIYENKDALERAFFVEKVIFRETKQARINEMFSQDLRNAAIIEDKALNIPPRLGRGKIVIDKYAENKIILKTNNSEYGFLVLTDAYYPNWQVLVDGKFDKIYKTDYAFRGVFLKPGKHTIEFRFNFF